MPAMMRVGVVGDYDAADITAHQAVPRALRLAARQRRRDVEPKWIPTEAIGDASCLAGCHGIWCVPGSPYRSMEGALTAIRFARERHLPFLGTCAGFQHAVIEYARNALGWADAEHAETAPGAARPVIAPLACALVEAAGAVRFLAGTRIAAAYRRERAVEGYHCSYGLNPAFQSALVGGPLTLSAVDDAGAVRAIELEGHPFFVATLFQPERAALRGEAPPLVNAFIDAVDRA